MTGSLASDHRSHAKHRSSSSAFLERNEKQTQLGSPNTKLVEGTCPHLSLQNSTIQGFRSEMGCSEMGFPERGWVLTTSHDDGWSDSTIDQVKLVDDGNSTRPPRSMCPRIMLKDAIHLAPFHNQITACIHLIPVGCLDLHSRHTF